MEKWFNQHELNDLIQTKNYVSQWSLNDVQCLQVEEATV